MLVPPVSRKHQTAEYQRNANIIKAQVKAMHKAGKAAMCWRGGGAITPATPYDVGHIRGALGSSRAELAPEHRHRTSGCCDGNRREGGRVGAMRTGKTRASKITTGTTTTWPL